MTLPSELPAHPPRWALALLELTLPSNSTRDVILGDLHEEFADDTLRVGATRARVRCAQRTAGIAAYALLDSLLCRSWVSDEEPTAPVGDAAPPERPSVGDVPMPGADGVAAAHGVARYTVIGLLAFFVLLVGIVGNTMLFTATAPQSARVSSVAGVGGVVLFVACAAFAAIIVCAGPRWRARRLRGA